MQLYCVESAFSQQTLTVGLMIKLCIALLGFLVILLNRNQWFQELPNTASYLLPLCKMLLSKQLDHHDHWNWRRAQDLTEGIRTVSTAKLLTGLWGSCSVDIAEMAECRFETLFKYELGVNVAEVSKAPFCGTQSASYKASSCGEDLWPCPYEC